MASCGALLLLSSANAALVERLRLAHSVGSSPQAAYDLCVSGWREQNFGLPIPPPWVLARGDKFTGAGMRIMRVPPFLVECIRDDSVRPERCGGGHLSYGVENPGLAYPVSDHAGRISFESDGDGGTHLTWAVQWTPLPFCGWFVSPATRWIVRACFRWMRDRL
jgi:hypothetical protein